MFFSMEYNIMLHHAMPNPFCSTLTSVVENQTQMPTLKRRAKQCHEKWVEECGVVKERRRDAMQHGWTFQEKGCGARPEVS
jgi:hypothetical protein